MNRRHDTARDERKRKSGKDNPPPARSLRAEVEAHPEKYPNVTLRKAQEGRTWLFFMKRLPKPTKPKPK